jgi:gliding motility-associated-like protein
MIIFSRWGQQIFETSDMVNGWDGNAYGQAVTAGLYCYVISYKSIGGQDYTKKGTVMVVR